MDLHIVIPKISASDDLEKCKKAALNQWSESIELKVLMEEGNSYQEIFNSALKKIKSGYILFLFPWVILKDKVLENIEGLSDEGEKADLILYSYERISFNQSDFVRWDNRYCSTAEFASELHDHPGDISYTCLWNKILSADRIHDLGLGFDPDCREFFDYSFLLEYLKDCNRILFSEKLLATFFTQPSENIPAKYRILEKKKLFNQYEQLLIKSGDASKAKAVTDKERLDYYTYESIRLGEVPAGDRKEVKEMLEALKKETSCSGIKNDIRLSLGICKGKFGRIKKYWTSDRAKAKLVLKSEKEKKRELFLQQNFYKLRKPIRFFHRLLEKNRYILLYCESTTMKTQIMDYYRCVKGLRDVRFFIYYPDGWDNEVPEGALLVKSGFAALFRPWDVVVCADANAPLYYNRTEAGLIYINHGLHMISYDGGETLYAYEEGKGQFSVMLEPNKRYAGIMNAEFKGENICHTGYKNAESIIGHSDKRDQYRKKFGFEDDTKVVAVFGTWGPDSLFHRVGNAIIAQAEEMMKDNYRFILSIHPKEYTRYDRTVEPLGEYIESLAKKGFTIRNPKEPSIDYMIAADVVICDYSTLCEEAMLAGKSVVLSEFPEERVWKNSIIAKYQEKGPVFSNNSNLKELIEKSMADDELKKFASSLVEDLLPPKQGYDKVLVEVTQKVLNGEFK